VAALSNLAVFDASETFCWQDTLLDKRITIKARVSKILEVLNEEEMLFCMAG